MLEFVNHADRDHVDIAFADRRVVAELAVTIKIAPDGEFRCEAVGGADAEGRLNFGRFIGCARPGCLHCGVDEAESAQKRDLVADGQHADGDHGQTARFELDCLPAGRSGRFAQIHVSDFNGDIPMKRVTASKLYARIGVVDRRIGEPGGVDVLGLRLPKHTDQIAAGVGGECRDRDRERTQ